MSVENQLVDGFEFAERVLVGEVQEAVRKLIVLELKPEDVSVNVFAETGQIRILISAPDGTSVHEAVVQCDSNVSDDAPVSEETLVALIRFSLVVLHALEDLLIPLREAVACMEARAVASGASLPDRAA